MVNFSEMNSILATTSSAHEETKRPTFIDGTEAKSDAFLPIFLP